MSDNRRYTIAVDFDGVLHSYTSGWQGIDVIPDPPVPGAIEWLTDISNVFDVVIFTTRGETRDGQEAVRRWLREWGWGGGRLEVTALKVGALVYVDDRGWRFDGTFPTAAELMRVRPWNKPHVREKRRDR